MQALNTRAQLLHAMPESLHEVSAQALFRRHHGLSGNALKVLGLCQLEADLLRACGGLPLALQVIGGALFCGVSEVGHLAVGATNEHQATSHTVKLWQVGMMNVHLGLDEEIVCAHC